MMRRITYSPVDRGSKTVTHRHGGLYHRRTAKKAYYASRAYDPDTGGIIDPIETSQPAVFIPGTRNRRDHLDLTSMGPFLISHV